MSSKKDQSGSSRASLPKPSLRIRANSSKVQALEDKSILEVEEQSEFSQWRFARQNAQNQPAVEAEEPEVVQPKKTKRGPGKKIWWVVLSFIMLCLLFIALVFYSPLLATRQIEVEGAHLLSQSDIEDKLRGLEGQPLTMITQQEVADAIGYQNVLRSVTIEAQAPHKLVVTLHERVPVAVIQDQNQFILVDNEGVQLTSVQSQADAHLPLISGGLQVLNTGSYKTMTSVLADLPSSLLQQVKSVDAQSPSTIHFVLNNGAQVNWGTADDSGLKAKVLTTLMAAVGGDAKVETYDVSSPLSPTTK